MDGYLEHQRRHNRLTQPAWELFGPHRAQVSSHLIRAGSGRLAVAGAGNCNDLDFELLLRHFARITLFDLDLEAVHQGLARQQQEGNPAIEVVEADCGAAADDEWHSGPLVDAFDVVASTCVLSQILDFAQLHAGGGESWPLLAARRREHLLWLLRRTRPGGWSLLFSDFLSSDTCPQLVACGNEELAEVVQGAIARRNFFTGLNPFALARTVQTEPSLRELVAESHLRRPWRWQIGPARHYAVCLLQLRRSEASFFRPEGT